MDFPYLPDWGVISLSVLALVVGLAILNYFNKLDTPPFHLFCIVALYSISFALYGFAFEMQLGFIFDIFDSSIFLWIVVFSIAFVAGLVVPGAPGGIGVREYVFMLFSQFFVDGTLVLASVVLLRVFSIVGDLLFSVTAMWVKKRYKIKLMAE